jgi:hypothetical protein
MRTHVRLDHKLGQSHVLIGIDLGSTRGSDGGGGGVVVGGGEGWGEGWGER